MSQLGIALPLPVLSIGNFDKDWASPCMITISLLGITIVVHIPRAQGFRPLGDASLAGCPRNFAGSPRGKLYFRASRGGEGRGGRGGKGNGRVGERDRTPPRGVGVPRCSLECFTSCGSHEERSPFDKRFLPDETVNTNFTHVGVHMGRTLLSTI